MLTKNAEKLIRSLTYRKNRKKTGLFVAEGMKLVRDFVSAGISTHIVYYTDELSDEFKGVNTLKISVSEMKSISALDTPSPILALFEQPKSSLKDFEKEALKFLSKHYAFKTQQILFKPTFTKEKIFRNTTRSSTF